MYLTDDLIITPDRSAAKQRASPAESFMREALDGLLGRPKTLPCKYFYDRRGSALFDRICELDEYYPTRTELGIMQMQAAHMAEMFGEGDVLVELGSGSSIKTRLLLDRLKCLAGYVPVDISGDHLEQTAGRLRRDYPHLAVVPVAADYTAPFAIPMGSGSRVVVYFPGSTIGNFHEVQALGFLRRIRGLCGEHGALLIGVDLRKDIDVLERAYNDAEGVTAEFNLNLLVRMNAELGADFDRNAWRHEAVYNAAYGRIEMHLVSLRAQTVALGGEVIAFAEGESIWTESSYKYTLSGFADLAREAGFAVDRVWTDERQWFSVQMLKAE